MFRDVEAGYPRVQAILDYVHQPHSNSAMATPGQTALHRKANAERKGVCRDFAHLAITLCRCMNIPARYCTGYLGDIGVPIDPAPMDFSAWFEVYPGWHLARHGCAPQHSRASDGC